MGVVFKKDKVWQLILIGLVVFTTLFYALVTNNVWEDFFITFKYSKNLVDGNGLVYHPGERVHGFTSVINTLLPALYYWLSGKSLDVALWLYKISSIAALIFGVWFFLKEYKKINKNSFLLVLFFSLLFSFEAKVIMFTTNGQEAGFMALFLLPSLIFAFNGYEKNWAWAGICWAGLIYTRPDGVVYIILLVISSVAFGHSRTKDEFKAILKAGLFCGVLYLPWFLGVWFYYGSPIPHTITAKASMGSSFFIDIYFSIQSVLSNIPSVGPTVFQPAYHYLGGWPYWIKIYSLVIWLVSFCYWLIPSTDRFGRFVSFVFSLLILYFSLLVFKGGIYPWYLPPAAILGTFVLVSAVFELCKKLFSNQKHQNMAMYIIGLMFVFSSTSIYFMTVTQIRAQQNIIEFGNRLKIALWLKENVKPGDSVFLEALGYIGYFSNAKMMDWPGLVSREVVNAEKKKVAGEYESILKKTKPSWLVLRPNYYTNLSKSDWFNDNYKAVKIFDVRDQLNKHKNLSGIDYLYIDAVFVIIRKINNIK